MYDNCFFGPRRFCVRACFVLSIAFAALVTCFVYRETEAASIEELQQHLSGEVLRFHVLANSDDEQDQQVKLAVRDSVLEFLKREMPQYRDVTETEEWIRRHVDEIETVAEETVADEGMDQTVSAAVTTCWFPDRTYGDVKFPAGNYRALRVEIGQAKGHNWWCVLYPELCFMDTTNAVLPDEGKQKLKNVLTEEEYSGITADTNFRIGWFFRIR